MTNNIDLTTLTIEQLEVVAFSNITDYCSFNGCTIRLKPLHEIDPEKLIAIREISQSGGKTTLKLHDKTTALQLLAKSLGLLSDFNCAIATLKKYGLKLSHNSDGSWEVEEELPVINPPQAELV